jgi:hypothetical protein
MSDQADQSDQGVKPWTVKNVNPEERNAAIAAAKRANMEIGPWLSRAIRQTIQADRQVDRAPAVVEPVENIKVRLSDPESDLTTIERMVAVAQRMAEMTQKPPPRNVSSLTYRLLRDRLKDLDGRTGST